MASQLQTLCNEILKDENGNTITPTCGLEKLLCCLVDTVEELSPSGGISEIDGGYPENTNE